MSQGHMRRARKRALLSATPPAAASRLPKKRTASLKRGQQARDAPAARAQRAHDATYRQIFEHKGITRQLLEGFIPAELRGELRLDQMRRVDATFTAEAKARRESDKIWQIPRWRGRSGSLYVMVEFQSSDDPTMSVRIGQYVTLLYEHLIKQGVRPHRGKLPPVLPIVLYNGSARWRSALALSVLHSVDARSPLFAYQAQIRYDLIDIGRLPQRRLTSLNTALSLLFQIERASMERAIILLGPLHEALRDPHVAPARRAIVLWLYEAFEAKGARLTARHIDTILEIRDMLSENIERWRQDLLNQGLEQGIEQGIDRGRELTLRELLLKQLRLKFGEDASRAQRVAAMTHEQLDRALERIITAQREDELDAP